MEAEAKRQEAWRQVEKKELTEGNMEVGIGMRDDVQGGHLTLKLTARVMTEDGVKYTCHCDWESGGQKRQKSPVVAYPLKTQWDVQYPYLVWLEWYKALQAKYPRKISEMSPFSGTALMTTRAVVEERLTKINAYGREGKGDEQILPGPGAGPLHDGNPGGGELVPLSGEHSQGEAYP